jgi:DNA-binding response OmpR family regulator
VQQKQSILIADDEPGLREIVRVNLEAEGYRVLEAADGLDALQVIQRAAPDLLVLDIAMPRMDGWEVLRYLESRSETAGLPVIILTARASEDDMVRGLEEGAVQYITKPFFPEDLIASVKITLDVFDSQMRDQYRRQLIARRRKWVDQWPEIHWLGSNQGQPGA